ncbi:MAG: DUF4270 family protein [bacterium]
MYKNPNIFRRNTYQVGLFLVILVFTILNGCKKEVEDLGKNLVPPDDKYPVRVDSTFTVTGTTLPVNKVPTMNKTLNLLGYSYDNFFGETKTDLAMTFIPARFIDSTQQPSDLFGQNPIVDSLIIKIVVDSIHGSTSNFDKIKIYELTNYFDPNILYYSNDDDLFIKSSTPIATFKHSQGDSLLVFEVDKDVANRLIKPPANSDSVYQKQECFTQYFHGIYMQYEDITEGSSFAYCNLYAPKISGAYLYFHENDQKGSFSYFFDFPERTGYKGPVVNLYKHTYTGYPINAYIEPSIEDPDNKMFVQTLGGVNSILDFSSLEPLKDSLPLIINKAELYIENLGDTSSAKMLEKLAIYIYNETLNVRENDTSLLETIPPDPRDPRFSFFADQGRLEGDHYIFNITSFIQMYLDGELSDHHQKLIVEPTNRFEPEKNTTLSSTEPGIKLKIYYTDLKDFK